MAIFALTNEYILLNAVDLSDHTNSGQCTANADQLDSTCFGPGGWRSYLGGLKAGVLAFEMLDDYAAASVDQTIWNAFNAGVAVAFEIRPTNAARSATNPAYTGNFLPVQWGLGGKVGDLAGKQLQFPVTGAISRQTS